MFMLFVEWVPSYPFCVLLPSKSNDLYDLISVSARQIPEQSKVDLLHYKNHAQSKIKKIKQLFIILEQTILATAN